eukprot:GFYU01012223.1.p1 GENE.GFYU01012223.1~~GFYU01012223.1.p1  ORF type:complete len:434 (-),score=65.68 GFYU01012223.1:156-1457(-)
MTMSPLNMTEDTCKTDTIKVQPAYECASHLLLVLDIEAFPRDTLHSLLQVRCHACHEGGSLKNDDGTWKLCVALPTTTTTTQTPHSSSFDRNHPPAPIDLPCNIVAGFEGGMVPPAAGTTDTWASRALHTDVNLQGHPYTHRQATASPLHTHTTHLGLPLDAAAAVTVTPTLTEDAAHATYSPPISRGSGDHAMPEPGTSTPTHTVAVVESCLQWAEGTPATDASDPVSNARHCKSNRNYTVTHVCKEGERDLEGSQGKPTKTKTRRKRSKSNFRPTGMTYKDLRNARTRFMVEAYRAGRRDGSEEVEGNILPQSDSPTPLPNRRRTRKTEDVQQPEPKARSYVHTPTVQVASGTVVDTVSQLVEAQCRGWDHRVNVEVVQMSKMYPTLHGGDYVGNIFADVLGAAANVPTIDDVIRTVRENCLPHSDSSVNV